MEKVNIFVGRFQPFTAGHYKCIEEAYRRTGLRTVICMMEKSDNKLSERNPFPTWMLVDLYSDLFNNDKRVAAVIPVQSAYIVNIGQTLRENNFEIAAWTCGTDRYPDYSDKAAKYHDQAGLSDDFEMIEIARDEKSEDNISATKVRNCLLNDDVKGFLRMMPPGNNRMELYNTLRKQICKVYGISLESDMRTLEFRVRRLENLIRHANRHYL
jgi:phosphopantetheine adenylyltransferase